MTEKVERLFCVWSFEIIWEKQDQNRRKRGHDFLYKYIHLTIRSVACLWRLLIFCLSPQIQTSIPYWALERLEKKQPKPFWVTHNIPLLLPTKSVPSMCAKIHIDSELVTDSRNGLFTKWMFFLFPRGVTCYKGTEQRDLYHISIVCLSGWVVFISCKNHLLVNSETYFKF